MSNTSLIVNRNFMGTVLAISVLSFTVPFLLVSHWGIWPLLLSSNLIFSLLIVYKTQVHEYFEKHYNYMNTKQSPFGELWYKRDQVSKFILFATILARGAEIVAAYYKVDFSNGINWGLITFESNIISLDVAIALGIANLMLAGFEWYVGVLQNAPKHDKVLANLENDEAKVLQTEVNRLQEEAKLFKSEAKLLLSQKESLQKEANTEKEKAKTLEGEAKVLQGEVNRLQSEAKSVELNCMNYIADLEKAQEQNIELQAELEKLDSRSKLNASDIEISQYIKDFGVFFRSGIPHIYDPLSNSILKGGTNSRSIKNKEGEILWEK